MSFPRTCITLLFLFECYILTAQDIEHCRDHSLFPYRMPHYFISECVVDCDSALFYFMPEIPGLTPPGKKTYLRYDFNFESMEVKPECVYILQSYVDLSEKIGLLTLFEQTNVSVKIFNVQMISGDSLWVKVECGGDENNDYYELTIVEFPAAKK